MGYNGQTLDLEKKFTVIITAHNRRDFIMEALDSVLKGNEYLQQTEIIVSKNFSAVKLDKRLSDLGALNLTYKKDGIGGRLSHAISYASGEILVFLEDDDRFLPGKFKVIKDIFSDNSVGFFHNSFHTIGIKEGGAGISKNLHKHIKNRLTRSDSNAKILKVMLKENIGYNMSSICVRRHVLIDFLEQLKMIKVSPDVFMLLVSCLKGFDCVASSEVLTLINIHNSVTVTLDRYQTFINKRKKTISQFLEDIQLMKKWAYQSPVNDYLEYRESVMLFLEGILTHKASRSKSCKYLRLVLHNFHILCNKRELFRLILSSISIFSTRIATVVYYIAFKIVYFT